jgi:hypothetical protein
MRLRRNRFLWSRLGRLRAGAIELAVWTGRKAGTDRSVRSATRFSASGAGIFRALGQSSLSLFFANFSASGLSYV